MSCIFPPRMVQESGAEDHFRSQGKGSPVRVRQAAFADLVRFGACHAIVRCAGSAGYPVGTARVARGWPRSWPPVPVAGVRHLSTRHRPRRRRGHAGGSPRSGRRAAGRGRSPRCRAPSRGPASGAGAQALSVARSVCSCASVAVQLASRSSACCPGTRRVPPKTRRPACWGVILARLDARNSRISLRLSTVPTVGAPRSHWGVLSVHVLTGTPTFARCALW
jgi:hypothetical protein